MVEKGHKSLVSSIESKSLIISHMTTKSLIELDEKSLMKCVTGIDVKHEHQSKEGDTRNLIMSTLCECTQTESMQAGKLVQVVRSKLTS